MDILIKRIVDLVDEQQGAFPSIKNDFSKVRKTLSSFAASEGKKTSELLVMDICDKQNHLLLRKALRIHIDKFLKARYAGETISIIKKLLKMFFFPSGHEDSSPLCISQIPLFLRKAFWAFPVDRWRSKPQVKSVLLADSDKREISSFTKNGHRILRAVLEVIDEYGLSDLESIFGFKSENLIKKIREIYSLNDTKNLLCTFYQIRKKLGFIPDKVISQSKLAYEKFPPKLKRQCEVFLQKALIGLTGDPEIERLAALKGISIEGLSESTINTHFYAFKLMMSRVEIDYTSDFDITDLLRIEIKPVKDETGYEVNYMFNPIVDKMREIERNKYGRTKRAGYDSTAFVHFLAAVKAIAVYNGIFSYHKNFNLAYQSNLDLKLRKKRKAIKRKTYDLQWIDSEIERLFLDFKEIVRDRSFIRNSRIRANGISDQNLRKCLFFVMLVTLRYMGVRQQLLRNCVVGENIIFEKSGRISFYWGEDENKNKVEIYGYLDPDEHMWTHKMMIDVLNLYFSEVYNYTKKNSVNPNNNQLLCGMNFNKKCIVFDPNNHANFSQAFSRWSTMFLEFDGRDLKCQDRLHTHFFRGICADWLHYECKVSVRNSASFIGDTEQTLRENYLSKNKSHNFNDALDEANKNKSEMEEKKAGQTNAILVRAMENLLEKQDALLKENQLLKEQLKKAA